MVGLARDVHSGSSALFCHDMLVVVMEEVTHVSDIVVKYSHKQVTVWLMHVPEIV